MLEPINPAFFESIFATRRGWFELGLVALCVGAAWVVDWRLRVGARAGQAADETTRSDIVSGRSRKEIASGLSRTAFPLLALILLSCTRFVWRKLGFAPFLIDIAVPLLIALTLIRLLVYGMRRLFSSQAWLKNSERAISFTIWGCVVLYFLGLLPEVANALDDIKLPIGARSTTLLEIAKGMLAIALTLTITLWLSGAIERRLLRASHIDSNMRAVLAKFLRAALLVVGVLIALQAIGFDMTLLTVFGGALGVGIGLGLQKLAANYIAGFTILLDRSIRLGDMITVDGRYGLVTRVTARYVVVMNLDGVEAIVPNETLITTTVLNHSYSKRQIRTTISLQVAYDSDVERALAIMREAALAEPRVLRGPGTSPDTFFVSFGENGINLELGFWIEDPEAGQGGLKSALNRRIYKALRDAGIVIPYPRRDVRIVPSGQGPVPGESSGERGGRV